MIKKFYSLFIYCLTFLIVISFSSSAYASSNINVKINGKNQNYLQAPVSLNGVTFVPMRDIFESLGAQLDWNAKEKSILAKKGNTTIKLNIGNNIAEVNGNKVKLTEKAKVINGNTLIPLRFVSESLGANVEWISSMQTIFITTEDQPNSYLPDPKYQYIYRLADGELFKQTFKEYDSSNSDQIWDANNEGYYYFYREDDKQLIVGFYASEGQYVELLYPLEKGNSWGTEPVIWEDGTVEPGETVEITSLSKTITTPIGTFTNVVEVKRQYSDSNDVYYIYYKEGIGEILSIKESNNKKVKVSELIKLKELKPVSKEEAVELVKNDLKIKPGSKIIVECDGEDQIEYLIHVYQIVIDDPNTNEGHTATYGWYYVNKKTGQIRSMF